MYKSSIYEFNEFYFIVSKDFIYFIFREMGREEEREGEKYQWVPHPGDLACNPGMCPDWELNWRLFGSQAGAQSTETNWPG